MGRGAARGRETYKGLKESGEEARGRGVIAELGFGEVEGIGTVRDASEPTQVHFEPSPGPFHSI